MRELLQHLAEQRIVVPGYSLLQDTVGQALTHEQERQLWNECSRLLTNCIIYYNAAILSKLLLHKERSGDSQGAALLKQVSPVAWQHINFYGRYEFAKGSESINLDAIIQELAQTQIAPAD